MTILVVGVNHKTAPIELREKIAFSKDDIDQALPLLAEHPEISEAVIVSTCNRVELYCYGAFEETVKHWLYSHKNFSAEFTEFSDRCYFYEGIQAVEHLMRVACGLDSLVLGEPEILGQVKAGFTQACLHGSVGANLSRLFRQAFTVAKKVRTSTKIGACPVSVASTAVNLIQSWLADQGNKTLEQSRVLIIGSGATSGLAAKYVAKLKPSHLTIAGRNSDKVRELAEQVGASASDLRQLMELVQNHEVIISATASDQVLIHYAMFTRQDSDAGPNQLILDLAVPRDVDPVVKQLSHVKLYCIDDLKNTIQTHVNSRAHAAQQADYLIAEYSREFMLSLRALDADEVIKHYRLLIKSLCQQELQKSLKDFERNHNGPAVLENFANNLANKIMHTPCEQMRLASTEGRADMLALAYELFGINN